MGGTRKTSGLRGEKLPDVGMSIEILLTQDDLTMRTRMRWRRVRDDGLYVDCGIRYLLKRAQK